MAYRVNSKVFETEAEARAFSRDLMARGGLGGWREVDEPVTHVYWGDLKTEKVGERGDKMKMTEDVITSWVRNNLEIGRTEQDIEDDFKLMLKQKLISVDDYALAMEIIYERTVER